MAPISTVTCLKMHLLEEEIEEIPGLVTELHLTIDMEDGFCLST
jgi:hypothetical protein